MPNFTIRKFLCGVSVGSLLILGISTRAHSGSPAKWSQAQSEKQTQQPTKSVAGKVAAIGSGGTSFTLEVTGGGSDKDSSGKNTLDFVVDKNTQVKGQVKQGTPVTVEYQAMENGQLLAVSIMAQA
jgi:hypothetical protein